MKKTFRRGYLVNTAVLIAVYALCVALSVVLADSGSFRLTVVPSIWQCCYLIILAASLNLVLGFMGQLSLGHCGFMAIGAYTAALMSLAFQRAGVYDEKSGAVFILIIFLCIICAGVLAAVFGVLVGIPALRLKGDYLAIITLGFGLIIVNVINNLPFAGQNGLAEGVASSSLHQNGREPTPAEIAVRLNMEPERVGQLLQLSQEPLSLEAPVGEEEDARVEDFVQDDTAGVPADEAGRQMLHRELTSVLASLTDREQRVLSLRFGLEDGRPRTLEELGQEFHVTRERVRQIEAKALRKLRHPSRARRLRDYLE